MRREVVGVGLVAGLVLSLSVLAYGCGQTSSGNCSDNAMCAPGDAASDEAAPTAESAAPEDSADGLAPDSRDAIADAGDGSDGPFCDRGWTPAADSCVVRDGNGVFVSPTGHNGAKGTKADPLLKVGDAIQAAIGHSDRVYACAGTYDEAITLGGTGVDGGSGFGGGVSLFGGLDCANSWNYTGAKAILAPSTRGVVLTVKGLMAGMLFEDIAFHAQPATAPGESSIAVFDADASPSTGGSATLTFRRCDIAAGAGQPGQDQMAAAGFDAGAPPGQAGTATGGGGTTPNTCNGIANASVGGAGGRPIDMGEDGTNGTPGPADKGTAAGCSNSGTGGGFGANGASGVSGAGAATWAIFDPNGWVPAGGMAGGPGDVGQGGGGGGSVNPRGGGGGGGAGGCGGAGGTAGTGGGSSVGVLAYQATIDIEQCLLTTANGGRGGNGAAGESGQAGGDRGPAVGRSGCPGGNGGNGGSGGGGGGGAGGVSAGVLWSGTAPTIDGSPVGQAAALDGGFLGGDGGSASTSVVLGAFGAAGTGGSGGPPAMPGADAGAGADGTLGRAGVAGAVVRYQ